MSIPWKTIVKELWSKDRWLALKAAANLSVTGLVAFVRPAKLLPIQSLLKKNQLPVTQQEKDRIWLDTYLSWSIFRIGSLEAYSKRFPSDSQHNLGEVNGVRFMWHQDLDGLYHLTIRGSSNVDNWLDNLNTDTIRDLAISSKVHEAYAETAVLIAKAFVERVGLQRVRLAGASMGGALSVIAALYLRSYGCTVTSVGNIGGPKMLKTGYDLLPVYTLQHEQDLVPRMPAFQGFSHDGPRYVISEEGELKAYTDTRSTHFLLSIFCLQKRVDFSHHQKYLEHMERISGRQN